MGSCWDGVARLLLVVINIIFLLLGLAITACGFILRYGRSLYEPFLETGMNQLQKALEGTKLGDFDVKDIDIGELLMSLAIGLIIGGLVLVALSFLGCCGACCKVRFMLWLYAIVIIVFVVAEAVAIGLLYGKPELVKNQLKDSLDEYGGLASSEVLSLGWNIIMIQFKCCGVDSYEDFDSTTSNWNTLTVGGSQITLKAPIACCKELPSGTSIGACAVTTSFDVTLSNAETGCYQTLWDLSFGNLAITVPVLVVCGIIQLLFIISAIMVARAENDKIRPV